MRVVCVICTEILLVSSHISVCNCGHIFHEECIFRWVKSSQQTCPQCRAKVTEKTIIKRLYLTETDLNASQIGFDTSDRSNESYNKLLNQLDELKTSLRENTELLKCKNKSIEIKDNKIKELETSIVNLKNKISELKLLVDYLKKQIESSSRIKEQYDSREKLIYELESKLKEYKSIELIYKEHESTFAHEMRKYLNEKNNSLANSDSIIAQLVRTNVLLKEHADKQLEEKRLVRKKLIQFESGKNENEKKIEQKTLELNECKKHNQCLKQELKQKDLEIEMLKEKLKRSLISTPNLVNRDECGSPFLVNDTIELNESTSNSTSSVDDLNIENKPTLLEKTLNKNFFLASNNNNNNNDDSDVQFLDEINKLEQIHNGKATNSTKSDENLLIDKNKNKLLKDDIEYDSPLPLAKRRKNPFLSFDLNDSNHEHITCYQTANEMFKNFNKVKSFNDELSLSQRISKPSPTANNNVDIQIVKPIVSNPKRTRLNLDEQTNDTNSLHSSKSEKNLSTTTATTTKPSGYAYLCDGLGGRQKVINNNNTSLNDSKLPIMPLKVKKHPFFTKSKVTK